MGPKVFAFIFKLNKSKTIFTSFNLISILESIFLDSALFDY